MDQTTKEVLDLIKLIANEEGMKATVFGTKKGILILALFGCVGFFLYESIGLVAGLIVGTIIAILTCRSKKPISEVIAKMPLEEQIELAYRVFGIGYSIFAVLQSADVGKVTRDGKTLKREVSLKKGEVALPEGKMVQRDEAVLAVRQYLIKEMGLTISK